jgi:PAS domain S-box-containing protein
MTPKSHAPPPPPAHLAESPAGKAFRLALRLTQAETELQALASGQIDAILDPDGKPYLLGPAQEHMRQNERRLQAVVDSVPDVITIVNRGGIILSQSRAARSVLGFEPEALVGKSIFEHVATEDFVTVYSAFFKVIEGLHEHAALQFRHRSSDGSYRIIHATVAKLHDVSPASVVFSLRPGVHRIFQQIEPTRRKTSDPQTQPASVITSSLTVTYTPPASVAPSGERPPTEKLGPPTADS